MPGTLPRTTSLMLVIRGAPPTKDIVTEAVVVTFLAGVPPCSSPADRRDYDYSTS